MSESIMNGLEKLKVFSKKLNRPVELCLCGGSIDAKVNVNDSIMYATWTDKGWNNSGDGWMDNGWNNSGGGWLDSGWNNSGDRWMDKGWNNSGDSWSDSGWSNSSGCYITTACTDYMGLPDDCHELKTLRYYRDKLVEEDTNFRDKVLDYYRKAPIIVNKIMQSEKKDVIFSELYYNLVQKCVDLIEKNEPEEAKTHYLNVYEKLVQEYVAS